MKDAALVAFVSPNGDDWRFSLVKMEYKFNEKGKVEEEFTPARRYSFLVGKNENSHTAQSRLLPLLLNDETNPSLEELEDVFSVEKVTKEFFEKYRALFLRLKESLDDIVKRNPKVKADFKEKNVDTADFAKKLLGQIVFLYFLQKKGWFGVPRDGQWGSGSKHFLRELFQKKHGDYNNFFNEILEPLFYEALRIDRSHDDDYYSRFNCRIPFLNGGLFDPINNYDWVHTDLLLPNDLFSNNRKTKEGDTGDGILDIFDRYNFTVKEDEPLEKEVAIDPEMLGKVFENLLEVKDRKSKGTYYTPREIVHYMCQESLVNYLATELEGIVSKEDIETLIKHGEAAVEHDATYIEKKSKKENTKVYSKAKLPNSIEENARFIDKKLETIRVCDPAVGSGAFLVGMMSEIIRTRNALTPYIGNDAERTPYNFKRHAIQNSLYGVDIDPGAVEIAKLRLWLSLIVDEEDIKQIKPLPNLDYKIMQGNSLLSEFMGIDFDKEDDNKNGQLLISQDDTGELIEKLKNKKDEYLNKARAGEKQKLKQEIEDLMITIFETKLQKQKSDYFNMIKSIEEKYKILPNEEQREKLIQQEKEKLYKDSGFNLEQFEKQLREYTTGNKIRPFFPWRLYFAEVFHEKKGFDVVIANPPYVRADSPKIKEQRQLIKQSKNYQTLYEKWDLYVAFTERGFNLLQDKGILEFIIPDAYMSSKYAEKSHDYFLNNAVISRINFCSDIKIFEQAVRNIIIEFKKEINPNHIPLRIKHIGKWENFILLSSKKQSEMGRNTFKLDSENKTFGDLSNTLTWGEICYVSYGVAQSSDEIKYRGEFTKEDVLSDIKDETHPFGYIEGKYIDKYIIKKIKYIEWGTERSPKKWRRVTFPELYIPEKIMHGGMTGAIIDNENLMCNHSMTVSVLWKDLKGVKNRSIEGSIKKDFKVKKVYPLRTQLEENSKHFNLKYLLAILNSKFAYKFLDSVRRSQIGFYPDDLKKLPIKKISQEQQRPFIGLVDKILAITKEDDYLENSAKQAKVREYEKQIDQLVYKLYGLTPEEIQIVEQSNP
jgi:hypothetical protein